MPRVQANRYPEDTARLIHCDTLARFLDGYMEPEQFFYWIDYGNYEHMKEMGEETNA